MKLVLDAEAVVALLEHGHPARRRVRQSMEAARRLRRDVTVASVTLAELYRGAHRTKSLDALLAREGSALRLRDTDRTFARLVGSLLAEARRGSEHLADAHVVAVAVEAGGGVVLTSDPKDLNRLAAPYRTVIVEPLG
jgi:predicted nucleic acid-binding protein